MQIKQGTTPTLVIPCDYGTVGATAFSYAVLYGGSYNPGVGSFSANTFGPGGIPYAVVILAAGETATLGDLVVVVLDAGGALLGRRYDQVVPWDPNDGAALGLSTLAGLPAAIAAITPDPWNVTLPGAYAAGKAGYILGHSSVGDPWSTVLPGSYPSGTAGYALAHNAAATASSVLSTPDTIDVGLSLAQAVKLCTAVLCGPSTVAGFVVTYLDTTDTISRVVATLDGTGQRTSVVYNTT